MKTYTGGCHCQKVRFEVAMEEPLTEVMSCNCSICSKRGWLLTFVPASAFTLLQGEHEVTKYNFNKNLIDHLFCKTCGTASYGAGSDEAGNKMVAINVRCLDGIDIHSLHITEFDGKSL